MSGDRSLRRLLAPMTEHAVDLDAPSARVDRERVLARMAEAGRRGRARRTGWVALLCAAAAGAVLLVFGARLLKREAGSIPPLEVMVSAGSATQVRGAAQTQVPPRQSTRIAAAGELETAADSEARVTTADGMQIELRSHTRVSLGELRATAGQVTLLGGTIRCSIPHRAVTQAFQVVTPDVTVVDLGTVFTVAFEGPNAATHISVEEGEVLVRHAGSQTRLHAPSSWSSDPAVAAAAAAPDPAASAPDPAAAQSASAREGRPATRGPGSKGAPAATLAIESRLLQEGLAAERQGRSADAISALSQLVTEYPRSPLAPDARAALARIEAGLR